ncbi:MAG: hypothetical protein U0401_35890 [Anaerolineae bacterium]
MNKPRAVLILPLLGLFVAMMGLAQLQKWWPYLLAAAVVLIGLIVWLNFSA